MPATNRASIQTSPRERNANQDTIVNPEQFQLFQKLQILVTTDHVPQATTAPSRVKTRFPVQKVRGRIRNERKMILIVSPAHQGTCAQERDLRTLAKNAQQD